MAEQKIKIQENGPYLVPGNIPLVRKSQISSEHGEPMTQQKTGEEETKEVYRLCRCGQSSNKPYCDDSHFAIEFDGTETVITDTFEERKITLAWSTAIVIKRDFSICADSGFCGNRLGNIQKLAKETDDSIVRAQVIAMIERCPSGSYSYSLERGRDDNEVDFPRQDAVISDMTSDGPIQGPLWVTGNITIERADGQPMETRNHVTQCRCGQSKNKQSPGRLLFNTGCNLSGVGLSAG